MYSIITESINTLTYTLIVDTAKYVFKIMPLLNIIDSFSPLKRSATLDI